MIHFRNEGEPIRPGFNIYPRGSGQIGFVLMFGYSLVTLRYSVAGGRLFRQWRRI